MKLDSIENYRPINNYVLVKPDPENDKLMLGDNFTLHLSTVHEPYKHAVTTGTVVAVPNEIMFYDIVSNASIEYNTELEVKVGDRVIFHFLTASTNMKEGKFIECNGEKYYQVKYDKLFCAIRGEETIVLNGFLVVEALEEELPKTNLIIPDTAKKKEANNTGIVRYVGKPLKGYRDFPEEFDLDEIQVGDTIVFRPIERVYLQNPMHQILDKGKVFYRMQRRDVLGKVVKNEKRRHSICR